MSSSSSSSDSSVSVGSVIFEKTAKVSKYLLTAQRNYSTGIQAVLVADTKLDPLLINVLKAELVSRRNNKPMNNFNILNMLTMHMSVHFKFNPSDKNSGGVQKYATSCAKVSDTNKIPVKNLYGKLHKYFEKVSICYNLALQCPSVLTYIHVERLKIQLIVKLKRLIVK
jgi:hypothetical protein